MKPYASSFASAYEEQKAHNIPKLDLGLLAAGAVVFGAQALVPAAKESYTEWYPQLRKPKWNPPNWVFPAVWTPLKLLQVGALWLAWHSGRARSHKMPLALALTAFGVHLLLGNTWNIVFFNQRRMRDSLPVMGGFWLSIAGTIAAFWHLNPLAGWLMVPTQIWVTIAAKLNYDIVSLNTAPPRNGPSKPRAR